MYNQRYAPSTYMNLMHDALPSPEYTGDSDSDSDVAKQLEQRRRQLNDEVARFQAQKDKEFKEFEIDLKARKRQQKLAHSLGNHNGNHFYEIIRHSPSSTPPTTTTFTTREKNTASPQTPSPVRTSEPIRLIKPSSGLKVTSPTICLDRINIRAETQAHVMPPCNPTVPEASETPQAHESSMLRSNHDNSATSNSPNHSGANFEATPDPSRSRSLVTGPQISTYLPLLDLRYDGPSASMIDGTQTQPASPAETSMIEILGPHSSSMPTESSVPENFKIPATKRAYTSPSVHRRVLAPIICNYNGRKRNPNKRKRVTFQLADRAIVQPSSSYEEGSSPEFDNDGSGENSSDAERTETPQSHEQREARPVVRRQRTPLDPFGRRRKTISPVETAEEEIGMSMADLLLGVQSNETGETQHQPVQPPVEGDYFASAHGRVMDSNVSQSPVHPEISTSKPVDEHLADQHHDSSVKSIGPPENELPAPASTIKRPLHSNSPNSKPTLRSPHFSPHPSPVTRPVQRHYPGALDTESLSDNQNVGFFELDEELASPKADTSTSDVLDFDQIEYTPTSGRRKDVTNHTTEEVRTGTSVPIDIVRPGSMMITSSWIGTFGH